MLTEQIKHAIEEALPGAEVHVVDPMQDNTHLEAIVISPDFEGLSLVKQHQQVMRALTNHFSSSLHALKLQTFSPKEWKIEKQEFLEG
jgi:acid stress-induced BolA-like protein IbaG/YrbA